MQDKDPQRRWFTSAVVKNVRPSAPDRVEHCQASETSAGRVGKNFTQIFAADCGRN
jgi:hypothetical protein